MGARLNGEQGFLLIAGRQIVTEENLEVLALLTDRKFEDGLPLQEVIQTVRENKGISVIPWGFGKWMGRRGRFLESALEEAENSELFLGDNSGRPVFWSRPSHFRLRISSPRKFRIQGGSINRDPRAGKRNEEDSVGFF